MRGIAYIHLEPIIVSPLGIESFGQNGEMELNFSCMNTTLKTHLLKKIEIKREN